MKKLMLLIFGLCIVFGTKAQETVAQKIGYADWEYIFAQLPDQKRFTDEMSVYVTQLENQLKAKSATFETKVKAYEQNLSTMTVAVRQSTETELRQMQQDLQKFKEDAEVSVRTKSETLMEPIFAKIGTAINEVSEENHYDFIFTPALPQRGGDILLYSNEKYDISNLVLKKLGVTPKPATPPAAGK